MEIQTERPIGLEPCAACGHVQNVALRWKYLAGCPDDHEVRSQYLLLDLANAIAHRWPDGTYSATRLPDGFDQDETERLVLMWLDLCHAGKVPRHTYAESRPIEFDDIMVEV